MSINTILGGALADFLGVTVVLFGAAAFMTGQALAGTWRPAWQMLPYGLLLAAANRFLSWALFGGQLTSLVAFVIDAAALIAIGIAAYRLTRAHRMITQYPWLYERDGLFSWRLRGSR